MKKISNSEMRNEYDFSKGIRGKYANQYKAGTNLVLLDPDVARAFPNAKSVNEALRRLLDKPSKSASPRS